MNGLRDPDGRQVLYLAYTSGHDLSPCWHRQPVLCLPLKLGFTGVESPPVFLELSSDFFLSYGKIDLALNFFSGNINLCRDFN